MKTRTPDNDPAHWRRRADEARRAADLLDDADAKQTMLEIAAAYERLVGVIERLRAK
jgi:hypothetical protein